MLLQQPFENAARSTACGFISIQLKNTHGDILSKPCGFALCRLVGNYFQTIEICELRDLPMERARNINYILAWSERVVFTSVYIDKDQYLDFNGDQMWSRLARQRNPNHRYPSLRATIRPDDPALRQIDSLSEVAKDGRLIKAKSLDLPDNFLQTYKPGDSPSVDALSGAIVEIIKLQRGILSSVAREQRELRARYG